MYKRSEVEKAANEYFNDSLVANVWLDKYALKINDDSFLENHPDDTIKRLSGELFRIEQKYPNPLSHDQIYKLLNGYNKFVLGGSCLFGIGNNLTLSTLGNCFVVDSPIDSIGGIWKTDQELAQLMKRRGGVGVDLSTIRQRKAKVNNAANSSTGVVPFMEKYSNTTRTIAQEGRRGALMISLGVDHNDIMEFIEAKDDLTKVTGANISVRVSDDFMKSVKQNEVNSTVIWNKIIHQAWKTAEPGLLFWDSIIRNSPADCYDDFKTISTNPCSELPLCAYDSCRLSAINLFAYVVNPFQDNVYFNYHDFYRDTLFVQRLMDDIIDLENEKIDAILKKIELDPEPDDVKIVEKELWNKIQTKLILGRRTGLGLMGLADVFAALNIRYGNPESIEIASNISKVFARASYISSINLAKERDPFPVWDYDKEKNNIFINRILKTMLSNQIKDYKQYGRRNIANLTIAPTGSISMLARVSSGIEPVFALAYTRKRKISADNPNKKIQDKTGDWWEEYSVLHSQFEKWYLMHPEICNVTYFGLPLNERTKEVSLPSEEIIQDTIKRVNHPWTNSTAYEINPLDKLNLQAAIQPWIDHSISVTYNLPEDTTEEQVSKLYFDAWELGLKGLTVYRDGSRESVLSSKKEVKFSKYDAPKRPRDLICDIHNIMAKGRPWKVFIGLMDDEPYEVFAVNGSIDKVAISKGILRRIRAGRYDLLSLSGETVVEDITHNMTQEEEAFTRTISWALRHGAKLEFGIEQLSKSEGEITSFSKAIARTLKKYVKDGVIRGSTCPSCGTIMVSEGGCFICKNCGNTKCE